MPPAPVRLYNAAGPDRVAIVSATPAYGRAGMFLVQIARGPKTFKLSGGTAYGPFTEPEIAVKIQEVVNGLKEEGFVESGLSDLLTGLDSNKAAKRAKAALAIGWKGKRDLVPLVIGKIATANEDLCSLVDALGMLGDKQAIPAIRPVAARKLLSRRRSAVEAMIQLRDVEGLAACIPQATEKLPDPIRALCETAEPEKLRTAIAALPLRQQGLIFDTLYELIGIHALTPAQQPLAKRLNETLRTLLDQTDPGQPFIWRYVKSIFKRAMLRNDIVLFGWLAHRLEQVAAKGATGMTAKVKSGLDGVEREMSIFRRRTQIFVRRLSWRWLRLLARHQPERYTRTAAEALIHYNETDAQNPRGLYGAFAGCYLLHRIVYGASTRFRLVERSLKYRFLDAKKTQPPANVREEAYEQIWDAHPKAYLRLLGGARLDQVQAFAHQGLGRHMHLIKAATIDELLPMLGVLYEPTVRLAADELRVRFNPAHPDLGLVDLLLADIHPQTREIQPIVLELAESWLRGSTRVWTNDFDRAVRYLQVGDGQLRSLIGALLSTALSDGTIDARGRQGLAVRVLAELRQPATENLDALSEVARRSLAADLDKLLTLDQVLALLDSKTPEVQAVAAAILARRPTEAAGLGLARLAALANHAVFSVRQAIHGLLRGSVGILAEDPSVLFMLVESDWPDTRQMASDFLRTQIDWTTAGIDRLMGLVDSNRTDVQDLGRDLVTKNLASLDVADVVSRVIQHPHPHVRPFAMLLVEKHSPPGAANLAKLEDFCRGILLDVWPSRKLKRRVAAFLLARGLVDIEQAKLATGVLRDAIRVQCQGDFEAALVSLTRLKLAWPELAAGVSVRQEAGV